MTRELRTRPAATTTCPTCGRPVTLLQETAAWKQTGGDWRHAAYGVPTGRCCEWVLVELLGQVWGYRERGEDDGR